MSAGAGGGERYEQLEIRVHLLWVAKLYYIYEHEANLRPKDTMHDPPVISKIQSPVFVRLPIECVHFKTTLKSKPHLP